jgi:hypothetical protein
MIRAAVNSPSIKIACALTGGGYFDYTTTPNHLGLLPIRHMVKHQIIREFSSPINCLPVKMQMSASIRGGFNGSIT